MNQYIVEIIPDSIRRNAFEKDNGYVIKITTPAHSVWHQGNTELQPPQILYCIQDGSFEPHKHNAIFFKTKEDALQWAKASIKTNENKDRNIFLLNHPSSVFNG